MCLFIVLMPRGTTYNVNGHGNERKKTPLNQKHVCKLSTGSVVRLHTSRWLGTVERLGLISCDASQTADQKTK